jgi:hypothetical protein
VSRVCLLLLKILFFVLKTKQDLGKSSVARHGAFDLTGDVNPSLSILANFTVAITDQHLFGFQNMRILYISLSGLNHATPKLPTY